MGVGGVLSLERETQGKIMKKDGERHTGWHTHPGSWTLSHCVYRLLATGRHGFHWGTGVHYLLWYLAREDNSNGPVRLSEQAKKVLNSEDKFKSLQDLAGYLLSQARKMGITEKF